MDAHPARVTRPRWQLLAAVGFILSTGIGGAVDADLTVDEGPPPQASEVRLNDGAQGNLQDGDQCPPQRGCEPGSPSGPSPESDSDPAQEPEPGPEPSPSSDRGLSSEPSAPPNPDREPEPTFDAEATAVPDQDPSPTSTPDQGPSPTSTPDLDPVVQSSRPAGTLWVSGLSSRPRKGPAWESLVAHAYRDWGTAAVADQDSRHGSNVFAGALVAVATGDAELSQRVRDALTTVPGTEQGGRTLALGRNLVAYVLAADLIGYRDPDFVDWVDKVRHRDLQGRTLISTHEGRPNNWGTHAGASRIAAALYLGDSADLDRAARVFAGWLGDREAYTGFRFRGLSWQCDPDRPVGINPAGCTIDGHPVGGVLPDDQRRGGDFTWPPPAEGYVWGALQGAVVQAELLHRAGYDAWNWSDQALVRALTWLHDEAAFPAERGHTWIPWLVNHATGSSYPAPSPTHRGKNLGYTDWTHS